MTTTNETDTDRAAEQARAQLDSIVEMVKRLAHCQEGCDDREDCELTDREIIEGLGLWYGSVIDRLKDEKTASDEEWEQYHDEDSARQSIEESPLSVQVRSGWASSAAEFEAEEYEILLCTGGPACRIIGGLSYSQPDRAVLQYQDWFTAWMDYLDMTHEEHEALLTYAGQFYFGE